MNLFLNCPEVIELDLSNNMLSKLPLEISFLTCLTKLDIRNNAFSNVNKYNYIIIYIEKNSLKIL
jgi:Leucine-rich repeat (LRR) protein